MTQMRNLTERLKLFFKKSNKNSGAEKYNKFEIKIAVESMNRRFDQAKE